MLDRGDESMLAKLRRLRVSPMSEGATSIKANAQPLHTMRDYAALTGRAGIIRRFPQLPLLVLGIRTMSGVGLGSSERV